MCKILGLSAFVSTILAFLPAQVQAQDAETIADIRCVIVGINLAGMAEQSRQSAGTMLTLYYFGRLSGRAPGLDIESLLITEIKTMTPADYESEAKRCGASLTDKGREITRIGKDISEPGQGASALRK